MAAEDDEIPTPAPRVCSGGAGEKPCSPGDYPSTSHRPCGGGDESDAQRWRRGSMLEMEIDAAQALADFAQMALLEREGRGRLGGEGGRGRATTEDGVRWRSKKRTKSRSPAGAASQEEPKEMGTSRKDALSPRNHQSKEGEKPKHREASDDMVAKKIDSQDISRVEPTSRHLSRQASFYGNRGKQNLSETEKEAKRWRRVLANRESARQTILRRQARCEELARMAAELTQENEKMKLERELVMKEYLSLRDTNMQLKDQMAKIIKFKIGDAPASIKSESPTSSSMNPLMMYGISPLPHSSCFSTPKSSNSMPSIPQHASFCNLQGLSTVPHLRVLMPSYPWFFPFFCQPASCSAPTAFDGGELPNRRGEHPIVRMDDSVQSCSSVETIAKSHFVSKGVEYTSLSIATKESKDAADSVTTPIPAAGGMLTLEASQAADIAIHSSIVKREAGEGSTWNVPEKSSRTCHSNRESVLASAAADARKRRKELTKLKHLLCRQGGRS